MQAHLTPRDIGWIEVVTGCMFSGKTEELIRRLRRAQYARQSVVVFKPGIDARYSEDSVGSHSGQRMRSFNIERAAEIRDLVGEAQVVGVDEAQFLDPELVDVCEELANDGRRVIVAGLDMDYLGRPFEPIPHLRSRSTSPSAGDLWSAETRRSSQRLVNRGSRVLVGETEAYEARCRLHWDPHNFDHEQQTLLMGANLAEDSIPTADE